MEIIKFDSVVDLLCMYKTAKDLSDKKHWPRIRAEFRRSTELFPNMKQDLVNSKLKEIWEDLYIS